MTIDERLLAIGLAASELNKLTDELSAVVNSIEDALQSLQVGTTTSFVVSPKYTLLIRRIKSGKFKIVVYVEATKEEILWHSVPRQIKYETYPYIPSLLAAINDKLESQIKIAKDLKGSSYVLMVNNSFPQTGNPEPISDDIPF